MSENDQAGAHPASPLPFWRRYPRRLAYWAIRAYQVSLSGFLGRQCRFLPTCSDYASEAIQRHGLGAGGWMGVCRICRCHPFGGSGYDPVPDAAAPAKAKSAPS